MSSTSCSEDENSSADDESQSELIKHIENQILEFGNQISTATNNKHMRCFAHSLQLVVKKSLKACKQIESLKRELFDRFDGIFSYMNSTNNFDGNYIDSSWYLAAFLDPEFKFYWLDSAKLTEEETIIFKTRVKNQLIKEYNSIKNKNAFPDSSISSAQIPQINESSSNHSKINLTSSNANS